MDSNSGFDRIIEERKNLGFFKYFQSADLSSESMRAFPYNFIKRVSEKDFSDKMVIRAQWGMSWDVKISKNPRFYYMEKCGWDQFVSDNVLGDNEFICFIHKGNMIFDVNIYENNGREMMIPRKTLMGSFSTIKKEQGESSFKVVKKEDETGESPGRVAVQVRKKKTEETKASKKKKIIKSNQVEDSSVPEFTITLSKSYLRCLVIPTFFVDNHIPNKSEYFKIHHANGTNSWDVHCLVKEFQSIFSRGYSKLAREYPLSVGDVCTFKLIKPLEFLLLVGERGDNDHMRNEC